MQKTLILIMMTAAFALVCCGKSTGQQIDFRPPDRNATPDHLPAMIAKWGDALSSDGSFILAPDTPSDGSMSLNPVNIPMYTLSVSSGQSKKLATVASQLNSAPGDAIVQFPERSLFALSSDAKWFVHGTNMVVATTSEAAEANDDDQWQLQPGDCASTATAFSADGQTIAAFCNFESVNVWQRKTGAQAEAKTFAAPFGGSGGEGGGPAALVATGDHTFRLLVGDEKLQLAEISSDGITTSALPSDVLNGHRVGAVALGGPLGATMAFHIGLEKIQLRQSSSPFSISKEFSLPSWANEVLALRVDSSGKFLAAEVATSDGYASIVWNIDAGEKVLQAQNARLMRGNSFAGTSSFVAWVTDKYGIAQSIGSWDL